GHPTGSGLAVAHLYLCGRGSPGRMGLRTKPTWIVSTRTNRPPRFSRVLAPGAGSATRRAVRERFLRSGTGPPGTLRPERRRPGASEMQPRSRPEDHGPETR